MSLTDYIKKEPQETETGIEFVYFGQNNQNLKMVRNKNPDAEFLFISRKEHHELAPTYEIEKLIPVDRINGWNRYKELMRSSISRMKCIRKIAERSVCKKIFLVGFYANAMNDFRYALKELVEEFYFDVQNESQN